MIEFLVGGFFMEHSNVLNESLQGTPFRFYFDRSQVERGVRLPDGRIVPVILDHRVFIRFDQCLDLDKAIAYPEGVNVDGLLTLNDWMRKGAMEVFCYDRCTYCRDRNWYPEKLGDTTIRKIIDYFKKQGYTVTKEAIRYCFEGWKGNMKSGYRDEKKGYHLFTPAGGINPLRFSLTTLDDRLDWQTTYTC